MASKPGRLQKQKRKHTATPSLVQRRSILIWVGLIVFACLILAAIYLYPARGAFAPKSFQNANVLLITIDTLRADHVPAYGYRNVQTPNIDRIASRSLIFEDVLSHSPITLPSHASILTSQLPPEHGVAENGTFVLSETAVTLAELLKDRGYETAAFISSFVLASKYGLDQGFAKYDDHFPFSPAGAFPQMQGVERTAEHTESEAEKWLSEIGERKFFCWIHFYDPHEPYDPPEPYRSQYAANLYDGEIAYTDKVLGRLFNKLDSLNLQDKTIIVLTSDHGEGLGDHGESTHAVFLYDATLKVPLLIRLPNGERHKLAQTIGLIDVAPTILEWLGIPVPKEMAGQSVIPLLIGDNSSDRAVYSESLFAQFHYGYSALRSLTTSRYKYVHAPKPELYDRRNDPGELRNLLSNQPVVARELANRLHQIAADHLTTPTPSVDPETQEKLSTLGYLSGVAATTSESGQIDPKDRIAVLEDTQSALGYVVQRQYQKALEYALPLVAREPSLVEIRSIAGTAYAGLQDYPNAIRYLQAALALQPDHIRSIQTLAWVYETVGNLREAERWYLAILKHQKDPSSYAKLAYLYNRANRKAEALKFLDLSIRRYDEAFQSAKSEMEKSEIAFEIARLHLAFGNPQLSEIHLRKALALTPDRPNLHFNLAQIYEAKGSVRDAIAEYEEEILLSPGNSQAYTNLGLLYRRTDFRKSTDCFYKVAQLQPKNPYVFYLLAENHLHQDNDLSNALELAKQAVLRKPDFIRAYRLMAMIYEKQGRTQEAKNVARKAKQLELKRNTG